jgi:hypothetical protein
MVYGLSEKIPDPISGLFPGGRKKISCVAVRGARAQTGRTQKQKKGGRNAPDRHTLVQLRSRWLPELAGTYEEFIREALRGRRKVSGGHSGEREEWVDASRCSRSIARPLQGLSLMGLRW